MLPAETNIVKDDKGDLVTGSYGILATWRERFTQLFHVQGVNDVRQTEMYTAEPLMPEPSAFQLETAAEKLKGNKSPGIDQIPAEGIKVRGRTIRCANQKLINSIRNNEQLSEEWKESTSVPTYKKGDKRDYSNYTGK